MFKVSDISIGINTSKDIETTLRFEDINDALNYIKDDLMILE